MPLKIVGAGFGRTGTLSLKTALERLGYGPCYHGAELIKRPEHIRMWHRRAFGETIDWDQLFAEFNAMVDWPASTYWRELAEYYPDAKVLLSVRPPELWWKSMSETLIPMMKMRLRENASPVARLQHEMTEKALVLDTFGGRIDDKDAVLSVYRKHIDEVRSAIDPARLLVFDVAELWGPLCGFLGVPVPDEPFPRVNDTAMYQAKWASRKQALSKNWEIP